MNGRRQDAAALCTAIRAGAAGLRCELIVCPPATLLTEVAAALAGAGIGVGGQDCSAAADGAHTGDISAGMLRDVGAGYVILGHSERRHGHGETSEAVRAKVMAAVGAGLVPIVCVGETEAEREAGEAEAVVAGQLGASLPPGFAGILAYEPVWAIGSGRVPTEAEIAGMHRAIRGRVGGGVPILYGGSVKPGNAAGLLALPEVGGALVGGASLVAGDFLAIAG